MPFYRFFEVSPARAAELAQRAEAAAYAQVAESGRFKAERSCSLRCSSLAPAAPATPGKGRPWGAAARDPVDVAARDYEVEQRVRSRVVIKIYSTNFKTSFYHQCAVLGMEK